MTEGYDRNKDNVIFKESFNVGKDKGERFLNVEVYSYDNGDPKIRIRPVSKNTNPKASSNKQWIQQKSISSITKEEVSKLIKALEKAYRKL